MIEDTTLVAVLQLLSDGVQRPWQQCLAQLCVPRAALDAQTQVLLDVAVPVSDVLSKMNAKKARKKSARAE